MSATYCADKGMRKTWRTGFSVLVLHFDTRVIEARAMLNCDQNSAVFCCCSSASFIIYVKPVSKDAYTFMIIRTRTSRKATDASRAWLVQQRCFSRVSFKRSYAYLASSIVCISFGMRIHRLTSLASLHASVAISKADRHAAASPREPNSESRPSSLVGANSTSAVCCGFLVMGAGLEGISNLLIGLFS